MYRKASDSQISKQWDGRAEVRLKCDPGFVHKSVLLSIHLKDMVAFMANFDLSLHKNDTNIPNPYRLQLKYAFV